MYGKHDKKTVYENDSERLFRRIKDGDWSLSEFIDENKKNLQIFKKTDSLDRTPLMYAIFYKNTHIAKKILSVYREAIIDCEKKNSGIGMGFFGLADELRRHFTLDINAVDKYGDTALHIAVAEPIGMLGINEPLDFANFIQELLAFPSINTTIRNKTGKTPADIAQERLDKCKAVIETASLFGIQTSPHSSVIDKNTRTEAQEETLLFSLSNSK